MFDDNMSHAKELVIVLEFDPLQVIVDPAKSVRYVLARKDASEPILSLDGFSDAECCALNMMLGSVLNNVVIPEINKRINFHNAADKEILELIQPNI